MEQLSQDMLLHIIFIFSIRSSAGGSAETKFSGNDTCFLNSDCTGVSVCDPQLGCVV